MDTKYCVACEKHLREDFFYSQTGKDPITKCKVCIDQENNNIVEDWAILSRGESTVIKEPKETICL